MINGKESVPMCSSRRPAPIHLGEQLHLSNLREKVAVNNLAIKEKYAIRCAAENP